MAARHPAMPPMRAYAFVAAALLAATFSRVAGHPICWVDTKTPDLERGNTYCPAPQAGTCCTELEEAEVAARVDAAGPLSSDCAELYKQVQCGQCHSYSGHLFAELGGELGVEDGLTMKLDFCEELVDECSGEIDFPTYDGGGWTYCEKHTGDNADDFFWSYPYEEPELFEPGLNEVFPDLSDNDFPDQTISMHQSPDGTMFWLGGQTGEIKKVDKDNMDSISTVMDISGGELFLGYEEGLLDFAFGPMFATSGYPDYFYVSYTVLLDGEDSARNRLSRFEYFSTSQSATSASEEILLTTISKATQIHAAGWCGFKPSDYGDASDFHDLYWTTGDGGPQTDTRNSGQDTTNLLGSVIRITVPSSSTGSGYSIPSGNLGSLPTVRPEICASGFRNPWRCGFDKDTDDLWCGDVGHTKVEEINIVECGNNYGWGKFEGSRCQEAVEYLHGPCAGTSRSGYKFPEFEYCHPDFDSEDPLEQDFTNGVDICGDRSLTGHAVIGGHVYRGQAFADLLAGAYVFADNVNRNVYYLKDGVVGTIVSDKTVLAVGFTEDMNGELMVITQDYKIYYLPCGDLCFERGPSTTAGFYLGCFADDADGRILVPEAVSADDMDADLCSSLCGDSPYFGTQYGRECWCGDADTDFSQYGEGVCDSPCTGTDGELCGGYYSITAYAREDGEEGGVEIPEVDTRVPTPAPDVLPGTVEIGCFADPVGSRLMTTLAATTSLMTAAVCSQLCAGFPFFGTQYSQECWCTEDATPNFAANGAGICNYPCAGDEDEICGGSYAMTVYQHEGVEGVSIDDPTPSPVQTTPTPVQTTPIPVQTTPTPVQTTLTPVDTPSTPVETGSYIGCFADVQGDRVLPSLAEGTSPTTSMNAEICAGLCEGFAFYGTQYSSECWCGSFNDYDRHGEGVCTSTCLGTAGEICGGYDAISVYSLDGDLAVDPTEEPVNTASEPVYLGCFADSQAARVFVEAAGSGTSSMTNTLCASLCEGSAFFATQYSVQCWCGASGTDYAQYGDATCDFACKGDTSEICGGFDSMSVYSIDGISEPATPSTDPTYLGCFGDNQGARVFDVVEPDVENPGMTTEVCASFCSGYAFFAMQFGQECWCGTAGADYEQYGPAMCDFECTGDASEKCGGYDALSVYSS